MMAAGEQVRRPVAAARLYWLDKLKLLRGDDA